MTVEYFARADFERAADVLRSATTQQPTIGLILGSGLGDLADSIEQAAYVETRNIPGWPLSTVEGHKGRVVIGQLEGQTVCVLQGRVHFYEGYTIQQVAFPVRVMQMLGISTLIVTNAAGGVNSDFAAGDLMLIRDHLNMIGMTGNNPLFGPNDESLGQRFPDMSVPYDGALRTLAHQVAAAEQITLHEGVYACLSGPSFETPAEIRMLRGWGADAVGMSTAPEVVVARHANMRVMGVSGISNMTNDTNDSTRTTSHDEVMHIGAVKIVPALTRLLRGVLREMGTSSS